MNFSNLDVNQAELGSIGLHTTTLRVRSAAWWRSQGSLPPWHRLSRNRFVSFGPTSQGQLRSFITESTRPGSLGSERLQCCFIQVFRPCRRILAESAGITELEWDAELSQARVLRLCLHKTCVSCKGDAFRHASPGEATATQQLVHWRSLRVQVEKAEELLRRAITHCKWGVNEAKVQGTRES